MATVAKDNKDFHWKGVQFVSIMFVLLSAGMLISTIMSTRTTQTELSLSPVLTPWDPNSSSPMKAGIVPAIYSPNSTSAPSSLLPEHTSGEIFTSTLGVQKGMRKVLIDSGANILLAP